MQLVGVVSSEAPSGEGCGFRERLWFSGEAPDEGKALGSESWSLLKFSLEGYAVTQKRAAEYSEGQQNSEN